MNQLGRLGLCLVLLLPIACGSGGGDDDPPPDDAPGGDPFAPALPGIGVDPDGRTDGQTDGQGTPPEPIEDCSVLGLNEWVDASMRDYYLYYDQVPVLDLNDYDTPEALVRELRVEPPDHFSNVGDQARQSAFLDEGRQFGYGFLLLDDEAGEPRFANVVFRSPIDEAGIERGDVLLAIDGIPFADIDGQLFGELIGRAPESRTPTFTIRDGADGGIRDIEVTSREFDVYTVPASFTEEIDGVVYGYLPFTSFISTSERELDFHFAYLRDRGVTELILDMRYNGGGYTYIAHRLASHIAGEALFGQPLEIVRANDKYDAERGFSEPFPEVEAWLELSRVAIIATDRTASSSEIVINGLAPYIDVAVIGSTTSGKPFQSRARDYCGKRLNAMEYISTNVAGGSVIGGLAPTCEVPDDVTVPFGAAGEGMLNAAVGWLRDGVCPAPPQADTAHAAAGSARTRGAGSALDGLGDGVFSGTGGEITN